MMDRLAERLLNISIGFQLTINTRIPVLLWVDDVTSCMVGKEDQRTILQQVNQFGKDHKLRWGKDKCQVMRVGKHNKNNEETWKIGEMEIGETTTYKYLGDTVTNDGRNRKNLELRKNKLNASTISIKTIAANETLNMLETTVLLNLHDIINVSALLTNSESWNLNKRESEEIERMEICAIKRLFDLPSHIPTTAILHEFGLLYTKLRIEQRQLIYLWKIINRDEQHWTNATLNELLTKDIGWGKNIKTTLSKYNLPSDMKEIKRQTKGEWTNRVTNERENKKRLIHECHKLVDGEEVRKTKTTHIVDQIKDTNYKRAPAKELMNCNKKETKTILISRYGMLECGKNFKGTKSLECNECSAVDDESHRLNSCIKYSDINFCNTDSKVDFKLIYSNNVNVLKDMVHKISRVWNVQNAHGTMNTD